MGNGYLGSRELEVSTNLKEVIPDSPSDWSYGYELYKFSFMNDEDCTIIINNSEEPIYLRARQGFNMEIYDKTINSFVIVESGIHYNFVGAY